MIAKPVLRLMRNEIDVALLIHRELQIHAKLSEGRFRFLCPVCQEMNTATNPKTNLARCFRCERNFNVIDLTMLVLEKNFVEAVAYLHPLLMRKEYKRRTVHDHTLVQRDSG